MTTAIIIVGTIALSAVYVAWLNGFFLKCPHCGKVGLWRFDPDGEESRNEDDEGVVEETEQFVVCRKCHGRVMSRWADYEGRSLRKAQPEEEASEESR